MVAAGSDGCCARSIGWLVTVRPTLFGYQFVFQCESTQLPSIVESSPGD